MALQTRTVYIDLKKFDAIKIPPSGGTVPFVASPLGTPDIKETLSWNLLGSRSVASTDALGYNELFNVQLKVDIEAYLVANTGLGVDVIGSNVSYNARIMKVEYGSKTDMYKNASIINHKVTFELTVYVSTL